MSDMTRQNKKDERGFILVLALVTMLAMTIIGLSVVMNMTTDMQLSSNERDSKAAFQLAEAGVQEAMSRIRLSSGSDRYIGEHPSDAGYRTLAWNSDGSKDFSSGSGDADRRSADNLMYGVTIEYLAEGNPEGFCDGNSSGPNSSGNHPDPNSTTWTCNDSPEELVMYGRDFNLVSTSTYVTYGKFPVYKVTSAGTSNNITRTIVAYVGASELNTDTEYGINTNACIDVSGNASSIGVVKQGPGCGCDAKIISSGGSCAPNKASEDDMDTYLGEDISKIIEYADEKHSCNNGTCSAPGDDIPSSGKIEGVVQDWGDFDGDAYSTMIYIDNPGREVSLSGNFEGRGILIITGDLKLSGTLAYEGLIYVFGDVTISGGGSSLNVVGGIMANSTVNVNGNIDVVYDKDTLEAVSKENSTPALVLWKRL